MASPTARRYLAGVTRNTVLLTFASLSADIRAERAAKAAG